MILLTFKHISLVRYELCPRGQRQTLKTQRIPFLQGTAHSECWGQVFEFNDALKISFLTFLKGWTNNLLAAYNMINSVPKN